MERSVVHLYVRLIRSVQAALPFAEGASTIGFKLTLFGQTQASSQFSSKEGTDINEEFIFKCILSGDESSGYQFLRRSRLNISIEQTVPNREKPLCLGAWKRNAFDLVFRRLKSKSHRDREKCAAPTFRRNSMHRIRLRHSDIIHLGFPASKMLFSVSAMIIRVPSAVLFGAKDSSRFMTEEYIRDKEQQALDGADDELMDTDDEDSLSSSIDYEENPQGISPIHMYVRDDEYDTEIRAFRSSDSGRSSVSSLRSNDDGDDVGTRQQALPPTVDTAGSSSSSSSSSPPPLSSPFHDLPRKGPTLGHALVSTSDGRQSVSSMMLLSSSDGLVEGTSKLHRSEQQKDGKENVDAKPIHSTAHRIPIPIRMSRSSILLRKFNRSKQERREKNAAPFIHFPHVMSREVFGRLTEQPSTSAAQCVGEKEILKSKTSKRYGRKGKKTREHFGRKKSLRLEEPKSDLHVPDDLNDLDALDGMESSSAQFEKKLDEARKKISLLVDMCKETEVGMREHVWEAHSFSEADGKAREKMITRDHDHIGERKQKQYYPHKAADADPYIRLVPGRLHSGGPSGDMIEEPEREFDVVDVRPEGVDDVLRDAYGVAPEEDEENFDWMLDRVREGLWGVKIDMDIHKDLSADALPDSLKEFKTPSTSLYSRYVDFLTNNPQHC